MLPYSWRQDRSSVKAGGAGPAWSHIRFVLCEPSVCRENHSHTNIIHRPLQLGSIVSPVKCAKMGGANRMLCLTNLTFDGWTLVIKSWVVTVTQSVDIHGGGGGSFGFFLISPAELRPGFQDSAHQDVITYEAKPQPRLNGVQLTLEIWVWTVWVHFHPIFFQ